MLLNKNHFTRAQAQHGPNDGRLVGSAQSPSRAAAGGELMSRV